ncbi:hypothetical protein SAMN02745172_01248 [Pseudoxanthobacter soli DSM 19599]|uniref:Cell division protein FtsL n=1 Tax=Pseudoxanthobacter soli DSM 19599 TaxID=1123029 RepID=A0A1M7ZDW4_9HYPH|nr:hypothetical protein [Pseudoxanthobacter soli]SHO63032.1 hypothetical protein SAMN02745172_01248 [Pseudoxanthobacter soli DSM 19599]
MMRRFPYGRLLSVLLALATIVVAAFAFEEKRDSAHAASQLAKLKREIAREHEKIADLKAEWALLDQPSRLQGIAMRYGDVLHLQFLDPKQIGTLADIPERPPEPEIPAEGASHGAQARASGGQTAGGQMAANPAPVHRDAIDALVTGSIGAVPNDPAAAAQDDTEEEDGGNPLSATE